MGFIAKLVLILAVVAGGAWVWTVTHPSSQVALVPENPIASTNAVQPAGAVQQPQQNAGASIVTDASLSADLQAFDTKAGSALEEQAAIENSFNDQPVQQTE